ncbi:MAG: PFL family protein [Clostridia bacterium]|nr:PFL family protein [Clostridia bacterium]MDE6758591.1 PFL family protein [Clostridia bacterium]MDE7079442.1 PFL family protein [Clostridia bacterium]
MYSSNEIIETINMISQQHLDVRTITLGISLFDCITDSKKRTCEKIYDKIMSKANNLVKIGNDISSELGVPIVNKRISVTPISLISASSKGHLEIIRTLDKIANEIGIDFLGGYSALVHKAMTPYEKEFLLSIPEALSTTGKICSSVNVATSKAGINMDAIALMGKIVKDCAYRTKDDDSLACAKLVVFANAVEDNPFMAGAFLGTGEDDTVVNVGVSGPGVVKTALEKVDGDLTQVAECIKQTAFKITRVGQLVAKEASNRLGASFGIVDLSLAPTPVVGDSVAHILEEIGLESVGAYGTTACLAMLNDAVKKGGIMACSNVGGLSGAFIPVSEDAGMIKATEIGALNLEKLEAMTAVCSVGLDMIAIPGDTTAEVISGIIADEIAIGVVNTKTTAVRVIPVYGKKAGEYAEFGGLLGRAPIMNINKYSPAKFINRGGRIPAPLHSNKN